MAGEIYQVGAWFVKGGVYLEAWPPRQLGGALVTAGPENPTGV